MIRTQIAGLSPRRQASGILMAFKKSDNLKDNLLDITQNKREMTHISTHKATLQDHTGSLEAYLSQKIYMM